MSINMMKNMWCSTEFRLESLMHLHKVSKNVKLCTVPKIIMGKIKPIPKNRSRQKK